MSRVRENRGNLDDILTKEFLIEHYTKQKMNIVPISRLVGCRHSEVSKRIKEFGLKEKRTDKPDQNIVKILESKGFEILEEYKGVNVKVRILCHCKKKEMFTTPGRLIYGTKNKGCGCTKKGKRNKNWKGYEDLSPNILHSIKSNAKIRNNIKVEITLEDIWNQYIKQDRKCAITGLPLWWGTSFCKRDGNASIDRIDSTKDYTKDNIQIILKILQISKSDMNNEKYINELKKCAKFNNKYYVKNFTEKEMALLCNE